MNSNQTGGLSTGVIIGIVLLIVLFVGGFVGYYFYIRKKPEAPTNGTNGTKPNGTKPNGTNGNGTKPPIKEFDILTARSRKTNNAVDVNEFVYKDGENSSKIFKILNGNFYVRNSTSDPWVKVDFLQIYQGNFTQKCWKISIQTDRQFVAGPCAESWVSAPQSMFDVMAPNGDIYTISLK